MTHPAPPSSSPFNAARTDHKELYALDPDLGAVYRCSNCGLIHITIGNLEVRTDLKGFQALVLFFNRAAANYELYSRALAGMEGPIC
jgi:hypothetical protein